MSSSGNGANGKNGLVEPNNLGIDLGHGRQHGVSPAGGSSGFTSATNLSSLPGGGHSGGTAAGISLGGALPGDDEYTWTGSQGNDWANAYDWYDNSTGTTGLTFPVNGDVAIFNTGAEIDDSGQASDVLVYAALTVKGNVSSTLFLRDDGQITDTGQISASTGNATAITIGDPFGAGSLIVSGGGSLNATNVSNYYAALAIGGGSTGSLTVTGAGSKVTVNSGVDIGAVSTGRLYVENGGSMTVVAQDPRYFFAGGVGGPGSTGVGYMTVSGAGSVFTANAGGFSVGNAGRGTVEINQGGQLVVNDTYSGLDIATFLNSTGSLTVTDSGSKVTDSGLLRVGDGGTGSMTVLNTATVASGYGFIGVFASSQGSATVSGSGSEWALTNAGTGAQMVVGDYGTGNLTVADGGSVSSGYGFIGGGTSSQGTALVSGAGSAWTLATGAGPAELTVGDEAPAV